MKDIIQQIMNQENLDEIYGYAQNALFKDGPVSITTLEILSYLKLFAPDYFSAVEEEILSIMGIFYKKPTARTLQSKVHRQGYRLLGTLAGGFFLLVLF